MSAWSSDTIINKVLNAIKELSSEGSQVVDEQVLMSKLAREGIKLSSQDLSKTLLILEILGYVSVQLSTKEDKLIKLSKKI